jgi:hypothetical protein
MPDLNWRELLLDIWNRSLVPWLRPKFVLYFFFVMVLLGGLGVWVPLLAETPLAHAWAAATCSLPSSECTFTTLHIQSLEVLSHLAAALLAVVAAAFADAILEPEANGSFRMFAFSIFALTVFLGVITLFSAPCKQAYFCGITGAALSLFLWWIVNARNRRLLGPQPEADAPTGGPTDAPLAGSLEGINY